MFGMASPTLHPLISKMYEDLPPFMLRHNLNVQIPYFSTHFLESC